MQTFEIEATDILLTPSLIAGLIRGLPCCNDRGPVRVKVTEVPAEESTTSPTQETSDAFKEWETTMRRTLRNTAKLCGSTADTILAAGRERTLETKNEES